MNREALFNLLVGNFIWQAAIICFCVYVALKLLSPAHAKARYFIAMSGFFGVPFLLIAPFLPSIIPDFSIGLSPQISLANVEVSQASISAAIPQGPVDLDALPHVSAPESRSGLPLSLWLCALWGAGALFCFVRLVWAGLQCRQWLQRAKPSHISATTSSLSRPVSVKYSPDAYSPMLLGLARPTILVPQDFRLDLDCPETGAQTRAVLEHEIAHLTRCDLWMNLAQRIVLAGLWWFAPLYWINAQIGSEREKLCDDMAAVKAGEGETSARALARALVDIASRHTQTYSPLLATGIHPRASDLTGRVARLCTGYNAMTQSSKTLLLATSLAVPLMLAGLSITTPRAFAHPENNLVESAIFDITPNQAALYQAADRGRTDTVRRLLRDGTDPNFTLPGDGSPLLVAAREVRFEIVKDLLDAGADPNLVSPFDGTPLIAAAMRGDVKIMRLLIKNGANVNLGSPRDGTPLIGAAQRVQVDAAKLLIKEGADVNMVQPGDETALINAAQTGQLSMVQLLVSQGADVSLGAWTDYVRNGAEVREWRTPLGEASKHGHRKVTAFLRSKGASETDGDPAASGGIHINRPSHDNTSAADGSWNIDRPSSIDVANDGVRITMTESPDVAALRTALQKDGIIASNKEAVAMKISGNSIFVEGDKLPESLAPKYFTMLKSAGINTSPTTKIDLELTKRGFSMDIGP